MPASKDHSGKPIISITDGRDLGEIKGLYLDPDMQKVAAVFVGKEGIINRKNLAVARADIQVIGVDVWLTAGPDTVKALEDIPESAGFIPVSDLRGREVQTDGGTKLCVIEDVLLDDAGGVVGFSLGKIFSQGPLAERKAFAREAVVNPGTKDVPMTVNLALAETGLVPRE